jgi:hypothetical protein
MKRTANTLVMMTLAAGTALAEPAPLATVVVKSYAMQGKAKGVRVPALVNPDF